METQKYFENLKEEVDKIYAFANKARAKGFDPADEVEIPLAMSMAEKVVGLIGSVYPQMMGSGIADRILDLEKKYGKLDPTIIFMIAEEVAKQNFCKFDDLLQAMDAGIRVGFAYITLGVVSSPIEGFTGLKIRKTRDGKDYLEANFAGPIRSAGTTASCLVLMLIDHMREVFGFAKYDPSEEEVKRVWTELEHFHDRITNLQYMPTEEEALFLAKNMPIQVAGDASEKIEVPNYKNLERVETDYLRSGFCLIMAEGLAQKAAKGFRLYNTAKKNGVNMSGFDWLEDYIKLHESRNTGKAKAEGPVVPTYIKDLVAGRPVFGHPGESGGLRFRYGRGRNSGFSAASLHPATMGVTDGFIATGTQLKIEKPTKGCAMTSCDSIEGPIVKMFNGSVRKLKTAEEAKKAYQDMDEVIYLGDMLFPFSDVANRNYDLVKPGYVEEWWELEVREKIENVEEKKKINGFEIGFEEAVELSKKYGVPLNPKFIFYWTQISKDQLKGLLDWLKESKVDGKLIFPYSRSEQDKFEVGKRALELLGVEHEVTLENVVLSEKNSKYFLFNLGLDYNLENKRSLKEEILELEKKIDFEKDILGEVNKICSLEIKDKAGEFIGSRMGRPEKAKLRKLTGSPNTLFPVGNEGGRLRSLQVACEAGKVYSAFPLNYCESCEKESIYRTCERCSKKTKEEYYFPKSKEKSFSKKIEGSEDEGIRYSNRAIDINHYYDNALEYLGMNKNEAPVLIKGIRGTSSEDKNIEHLVKGVLRGKYGLQVNKDGTVRVDATELPVTHFKPSEISVSVEKLKEIGYDEDVNGNPLENENQILELMPHDVVLPCSPDSLDEKCDDVFAKVADFVDELLVKLYKMEKNYNIKNKEDLVGTLGVCMAPHNCAGVVCRFIGFSKTQGLLASPYMHAAIRRDCDGDEAAIMLLGDVLLNFSKKFLPGHRGGTQDAPLVLNVKIDAGEVDDQILDFEVTPEGNYPLELYQLAEQKKHSGEVKGVQIIKGVLKEGKDPFRKLGYTHETSDFNDGVLCSSYKLLGAMQEKVQHQMELVEKLRAVDAPDTARLIIERHFIRDMRGNLRKFSQQEFRCVACNEIVRRPPLNGVCPVCKGKLIFTIHEGGIKKYLQPALDLAKSYDLSKYLQQNLELVKGYIDSIFGKELEKQEAISKWF